jgi:cbb3-type cytochrome oxidase subunit 3
MWLSDRQYFQKALYGIKSFLENYERWQGMHPKIPLMTLSILFLLLIVLYAIYPTWEENETIDTFLGVIFILALSWLIISCIYWAINRVKGRTDTSKLGHKHYKSKHDSSSSSD